MFVTLNLRIILNVHHIKCLQEFSLVMFVTIVMFNIRNVGRI